MGLPLSSQAPQPPFRSDPPLFPELSLTHSHILFPPVFPSLSLQFSPLHGPQSCLVLPCATLVQLLGTIRSFLPQYLFHAKSFSALSSPKALLPPLCTKPCLAAEPQVSLQPAWRRALLSEGPLTCVFISLSTFGFFFPSWGKLLLFLTPSQILESSCEQASHQR